MDQSLKFQLRYGQVNPVDFIRKSQSPLTAAFLVAGAKIPVGTTKEPHWPNAAQLKFVAALLWVALDPDLESMGLPRNMKTVWMVLSNPDLEKESLRLMRQSDNPIVAQQAATFLRAAKGNTEISGIKSHLNVSLTKTLGEDRIIETMLDTNIDFAEMNKRSMSVYIVLPGYMARTHYSFMVLLISIALSQIEQGGLQAFDSEQAPTLFMLDEFATLGKFDPIVEAMGRMREYGLKCMTMVQALSQLKTIYGDDFGTIMGTAGCVQLLGGTNDQFTADTISKLCGTKTLMKTVSSEDLRTSGQSQSYQTYGIPVIMPDEILRLQLPEQIIKIDGLDPMQELALDPDLSDFPDYIAFMTAIEQGFDPDDAAAFAEQYRPGPHQSPPPPPPPVPRQIVRRKQSLWAGLMGQDFDVS